MYINGDAPVLVKYTEHLAVVSVGFTQKTNKTKTNKKLCISYISYTKTPETPIRVSNHASRTYRFKKKKANLFTSALKNNDIHDFSTLACTSLIPYKQVNLFAI